MALAAGYGWRGARSVAIVGRVRVKAPARDCFPVMRGQFVRLRPGIDRKALDFLPVAVRERPGSSAISAGGSSFWHWPSIPPMRDRRSSQGLTVLTGFASAVLRAAA